MAKIISIGNISMGGTGKTPFTIMLAKLFISSGKKVCILSRGYKGRVGYDTNVVSDGTNILLGPDKAADEPYMMAVNCPEAIIITGKERTRSYEYAEKNFQPDIYLLDDGFQHKKMKRDIDICLLDHKNPVSTGMIFPFGYLREPASALNRADIIVFTRAEEETIPEKTAEYIKDKPVFFSNIEFKGLYGKDGKADFDLKGKRVFAFAGIASPKKFVKFAESLGMIVEAKKYFTDHHSYLDREAYAVWKKTRDLQADFAVCTEKDFVKLPEDGLEGIYYLKIDINVKRIDELFDLLNR